MDVKSIRAIRVKKRGVATTGRQPGDPTPEEIAARCAEIRESWPEATRSSRKAQIRPLDMGTVYRIVGGE